MARSIAVQCARRGRELPEPCRRALSAPRATLPVIGRPGRRRERQGATDTLSPAKGGHRDFATPRAAFSAATDASLGGKLPLSLPNRMLLRRSLVDPSRARARVAGAHAQSHHALVPWAVACAFRRRRSARFRHAGEQSIASDRSALKGAPHSAHLTPCGCRFVIALGLVDPRTPAHSGASHLAAEGIGLGTDVTGLGHAPA